jgi:hypothetical protein
LQRLPLRLGHSAPVAIIDPRDGEGAAPRDGKRELWRPSGEDLPASEQLTYRSDKPDGPTAGTAALDPLEFLIRVR